MPNKPTHQNIADYKWMKQYLQLLVGRFKNLPSGTDQISPSYQEAQCIVEKANKPPDDDMGPTWDDVYRLELVLVSLEPLQLVKRRRISLEAEYQELVSPEEYDQYKKAERSDCEGEQEEEVRASIQYLVHEVQWGYTVLWTQEAIRKSRATTLVQLIVAVLFCDVVAGLGLGVWRGLSSLITVVALTILTGALGALTSALRRVQTVELGRNSDLSIVNIERSVSVALTSAVLGIVFSILLYLLFAGGLLKGALFPDMTFSNDATLSIWEFVPKTTSDYAKMLIWTFIAGFAERLVPDRLEQLSKTNATQEKGN